VGEDRQRFRCAMLVDQAIVVPVGGFVIAQEEAGRFGEGPGAVDVPDLLVPGAIAFAGLFLRAADKPRIRGTALNPGEAGDDMDLVPEHHGEDLPHPQDAALQVEAVGLVLLGGLREMEL
jgi:hypothetical protein